MYCHNCGHRNPQGANFCSTCGATLKPSEQADTTITFVPEIETEGTQEVSLPVEELAEDKAILVIRRGPEAGTRFVLDRDETTCGRQPASDIFLDDVTVSRKHAEIRREGTSFTIADVGSLNGTFVNRARVDVAPLANGDEIQIGKFKLAFFTEATP